MPYLITINSVVYARIGVTEVSLGKFSTYFVSRVYSRVHGDVHFGGTAILEANGGVFPVRDVVAERLYARPNT